MHPTKFTLSFTTLITDIPLFPFSFSFSIAFTLPTAGVLKHVSNQLGMEVCPSQYGLASTSWALWPDMKNTPWPWPKCLAMNDFQPVLRRGRFKLQTAVDSCTPVLSCTIWTVVYVGPLSLFLRTMYLFRDYMLPW